VRIHATAHGRGRAANGTIWRRAEQRWQEEQAHLLGEGNDLRSSPDHPPSLKRVSNLAKGRPRAGVVTVTRKRLSTEPSVAALMPTYNAAEGEAGLAGKNTKREPITEQREVAGARVTARITSSARRRSAVATKHPPEYCRKFLF